jgi:hypothetical protein
MNENGTESVRESDANNSDKLSFFTEKVLSAAVNYPYRQSAYTPHLQGAQEETTIYSRKWRKGERVAQALKKPGKKFTVVGKGRVLGDGDLGAACHKNTTGGACRGQAIDPPCMRRSAAAAVEIFCSM